MELLKITEQDGRQLVDARELHGKLGSKRQFSNWIRDRIREYKFSKGLDYISFNKIVKRENGANSSTEYALSMNMAKELALVEKTPMGRRIRLYFIGLEEDLKYALEQSTIALPRPLNIHGMEAVSYEHWLLQHGYSLTSGSVRGRIRKNPGHFHKHSNGKWYISSAYGKALLGYREHKKFLENIAYLPKAAQLELFTN